MNSLTKFQCALLILLRIAIGWHFLFEGVTKIVKDGWTSAGYLQASTGPLSGLFKSVAENPALLQFADTGTILVLIAGGLCLMLGLFTRISTVACIALLALFYLAMPPVPLWSFESFSQYQSQLGGAFWAGVQQPGTEGNYLFVNKNLIELLALFVLLAFDTGKIAGLDIYIHKWRTQPAINQTETATADSAA